METVNSLVRNASELLWNTPDVFPVMVALLLCTGLFLTVKLRFVQVRRLGHSIKAVAGKFDDPADKGDISHFRALSAALSATVGIGNIAGVATAIHYGGPGAVFWLWITGFIGMATKFTECTLAHKYRDVHQDGSVSGGPMYYMKKALGGKWTWAAYVFAICAAVSSFGSGNAVQAFTMADSFRTDFGIPTWVSGLVSASLVACVILGGIRRIGAVASRLVPFMGILYSGAALLIVVLNIDRLPEAVSLIVSEAFTPTAGVGGFAGSTWIFGVTWGVKRGLFSNEAGQGSAPIAHAAARTREPVREGAVALLEPFIDTVVICFMTGLVIVLMGVWHDKVEDRVNLGAGSDITVVPASARVQTNGVVAEADLLTGTVLVRDGGLQGAALVRNHGTIEELRLLMEEKPFNGVLEVHRGRISKIRTAHGTEVNPAAIVATGRMMLNGSPITAASFQQGLACIFPYGNLVVTISVFLFALSTAISWSYYGDRSVQFVFGPRAVIVYRVLFVIMHFLGAVFSLELVWGFADVALGVMAIPNLVAIILLSGMVKRDAADYYRRMGHKGL